MLAVHDGEMHGARDDEVQVVRDEGCSCGDDHGRDGDVQEVRDDVQSPGERQEVRDDECRGGGDHGRDGDVQAVQDDVSSHEDGQDDENCQSAMAAQLKRNKYRSVVMKDKGFKTFKHNINILTGGVSQMVRLFEDIGYGLGVNTVNIREDRESGLCGLKKDKRMLENENIFTNTYESPRKRRRTCEGSRWTGTPSTKRSRRARVSSSSSRAGTTSSPLKGAPKPKQTMLGGEEAIIGKGGMTSGRSVMAPPRATAPSSTTPPQPAPTPPIITPDVPLPPPPCPPAQQMSLPTTWEGSSRVLAGTWRDRLVSHTEGGRGKELAVNLPKAREQGDHRLHHPLQGAHGPRHEAGRRHQLRGEGGDEAGKISLGKLPARDGGEQHLGEEKEGHHQHQRLQGGRAAVLGEGPGGRDHPHQGGGQVSKAVRAWGLQDKIKDKRITERERGPPDTNLGGDLLGEERGPPLASWLGRSSSTISTATSKEASILSSSSTSQEEEEEGRKIEIIHHHKEERSKKTPHSSSIYHSYRSDHQKLNILSTYRGCGAVGTRAGSWQLPSSPSSTSTTGPTSPISSLNSGDNASKPPFSSRGSPGTDIIPCCKIADNEFSGNNLLTGEKGRRQNQPLGILDNRERESLI